MSGHWTEKEAGLHFIFLELRRSSEPSNVFSFLIYMHLVHDPSDCEKEEAGVVWTCDPPQHPTQDSPTRDPGRWPETRKTSYELDGQHQRLDANGRPHSDQEGGRQK